MRLAKAFLYTAVATALVLSAGPSMADVGGRTAKPAPQKATSNTFTGKIFPKSPYEYDDRLAPKGVDAPYNFPVPHPSRDLNIHLIPPAYAFNGLVLADRMLVQNKLAEYGYYTGAVDGRWGALTYNALIFYAVELNIEERLATKASTLQLFKHITS